MADSTENTSSETTEATAAAKSANGKKKPAQKKAADKKPAAQEAVAKKAAAQKTAAQTATAQGGSGAAAAAAATAAGQIADAANSASGAAGQTAAPRQLDKVGILGHVAWLMTQSPMHKHVFITDLEWLVMPALALNQFRIWHGPAQAAPGIPAGQLQAGARMPIAYASWAYLDAESEERIKHGIKNLRPTDWKAGEALWLIDVIAPFGGAEKIIQELKAKVFPTQTIKSLQPSPTGEGVAVMEW